MNLSAPYRYSYKITLIQSSFPEMLLIDDNYYQVNKNAEEWFELENECISLSAVRSGECLQTGFYMYTFALSTNT